VPLAVSMQKGCTLNKIQIVLKSFVPVLFYNLSLNYIIVRLCILVPLDLFFPTETKLST